MNFKAEFERIIAELEAHPDVEVYGWELGEPASAEHVRASIEAVGITPTQAMLDFYTAHDGAYLEWGLAGEEYNITGGLGGFADYGNPPGSVNILPAQRAFSPSWQENYTINESVGDETWNLAYGEDDPEELPTAVVIDLFSNYHHTDLLLGPEPLLVVASDHGADLGCSDFLTFAQYLELVIARYGASPYEAVGIGWSRSARRVESIAHPSLDDILARIKEDAA